MVTSGFSGIILFIAALFVAQVVIFLSLRKIIARYRQNEVLYRRAMKVMEYVDEMKSMRIEELESQLDQIREEM